MSLSDMPTFDVEDNSPRDSQESRGSSRERDSEPADAPKAKGQQHKKPGKRRKHQRHGSHVTEAQRPAHDSWSSGALSANQVPKVHGLPAGALMRRATQAVLDTESLVKSRTHISIRRPTKAEFKRSGVTEEDFDELVTSDQMRRLTEVFGDAHVPSSNMLLHIAANRVETQSVVPEMFKLAEEIHRDDTVKNSHCDGRGSVGQMLYRWNFNDIDVPWQLITEELNANARREIKKNWVMLDPDCLFRQCWDIAQVVLLVYMAFQLPYRVGFSIPDPVLWCVLNVK